MAELAIEEIKFMHLLAYMYMQQSKYLQALQLFRILRLHTSNNTKIALTLALCLHKVNRLEEAMRVLNSLDVNVLSMEQKLAFYFISSKVLWDLKKVTESREMLHNYLKLRKINS